MSNPDKMGGEERNRLEEAWQRTKAILGRSLYNTMVDSGYSPDQIIDVCEELSRLCTLDNNNVVIEEELRRVRQEGGKNIGLTMRYQLNNDEIYKKE
ncbi:MAG: hypothetical protein UR28_C0020G0002 [Candidatus Peregrinibacteria bacterium GW2011_GWF2_33_10]|nr:MAG: hypothetical protein UR28_C0020G0002 [Candidatus Peregrinibacteria bacterium GW2011_GWF2_33_10]OGJ45402.1 MAG: hypothetical protein A2263_04000 [Candidatus Peregrinibacteria bacterium RIFOXYA2_FULL_33_21]OGJ51005.1 MAG: hypothetical protein A2307_05595 [Candidatus Peregrinibacteria bacterium RIFOXYB2_FULL_33_20]